MDKMSSIEGFSMDRQPKIRFPDKNRITESRKIEFLYLQYAKRKFHFDCINNIINISEWSTNYFELFRAIAENHCKEYVEFDGLFLNKETLLNGNFIYKLHANSSDFIFSIMNELITAYHNCKNENPEFICDFIYHCEDEKIYKYRNSEYYSNFINNIIRSNEKNLEYITNICINYGYYPKELISMNDTVHDYRSLIENKIYNFEPFITFYKYSHIVTSHFISETGTCYFEKHKKGFLYLYFDVFSKINIDDAIKYVKIGKSRKNKRNFSNEKKYSNSPNMQLCVNISDEFKIKETIDEVRNALLVAISYYNPSPQVFSKEIQSLQWRCLQAKHKKISYLRRFVGLFIWDMVHIQKIKLGDIIDVILAAVDNPKNLPSKPLPDHILKATQDWAVLLSDSGPNVALETSSLDREYRLAVQSVRTMSICQHVPGNADNKLTKKE